MTIPANRMFAMFAINVWARAQPDGVAIQNYRNESPDDRPYETCAMGNAITSFAGYTTESMTFFVYVKNNGISANPVYLRGWYMSAS